MSRMPQGFVTRFVLVSVFVFAAFSSSVMAAKKSSCISCHKKITPGIVKDFLSGAMCKKGLDCSACHGKDHQSKGDTAKVSLPTEKTLYVKCYFPLYCLDTSKNICVLS